MNQQEEAVSCKKLLKTELFDFFNLFFKATVSMFPDEIWMKIFSYLPNHYNLSQVSRSFYRISCAQVKISYKCFKSAIALSLSLQNHQQRLDILVQWIHFFKKLQNSCLRDSKQTIRSHREIAQSETNGSLLGRDKNWRFKNWRFL
jgi:F-box-like